MAKAIQAPSGPRVRDSTVPQTSQRDYSWPLWSRCADCALAVLSSGDGHLPPRSFLRDKLSSRCGWSRTHRCVDTRHPGGIVGSQSCPSARGNHTHLGTGTAFPSGLVAAFASSLSANEASEAAEPTPVPRRSLPPGAVVSVPVLACCEIKKKKCILDTSNHRILRLLIAAGHSSLTCLRFDAVRSTRTPCPDTADYRPRLFYISCRTGSLRRSRPTELPTRRLPRPSPGSLRNTAAVVSLPPIPPDLRRYDREKIGRIRTPNSSHLLETAPTRIILFLVLHDIDDLPALTLLIRYHRILREFVLVGGDGADAARVLVRSFARWTRGVQSGRHALQKSARIGGCGPDQRSAFALNLVPGAIRILQGHALAARQDPITVAPV